MGDMFLCTDNPIIVNNTKNLKTIMCIQRKAKKKIPAEHDIIEGNKLAFNNDIGSVTNRVTAMFEVQAGFEPSSKEYETLSYRIMCGQLYQQNTIDRIKGIISKPMPEYWYANKSPKEMPNKEEELNKKIVADRKPYFMTYVYPELRTKNRVFFQNANSGARRKFEKYGIHSVDDLQKYEPKTKAMQQFCDNYIKFIPTGNGTCLVNRICWLFESELDCYLSCKLEQPSFDYSILKNGAEYDSQTYGEIYSIYCDYLLRMDNFQRKCRTEKVDSDFRMAERLKLANLFRSKCELVCTNEKELCDIVIDICYPTESSKQFAWDICGKQIVNNLLSKNGNKITYPAVVADGGEFEFLGRQLEMKTKVIYEADNIE